LPESRIYAAIDLKSFHASVECMERGLDPLTTNLVVADAARTEKTICLAVSPSLKAHGIPGRPRLFEVVQKVQQINARRLAEAIRLRKAVRQPDGRWGFAASSCHGPSIAADPALELSYITAPPHMAKYMDYSTRIYQVYLKYIAPEDIHVYSVDEVFIDVTPYLALYRTDARQLISAIVQEVLAVTGITAAAGIGTNLYLAKVAMDIVAKHVPSDENGVRIAQLDELSYRQQLWAHTPLTDFWRVGRGYARKLERVGLYTMGDIARCSIGRQNDFHNEELLYKMFGVNAELLIDHAWGWESCTMADIKAYRPQSHSLGSGQVLSGPYTVEKARIIVQEMADALVLDMVSKGLVTDQMVLAVGYDIDSLRDPTIRSQYHGPIITDPYGRQVPKHAHGSINLGSLTSSTRRITDAVLALYDRIVDPILLVRRLNIVAARILPEPSLATGESIQQLDFFSAITEEAPPDHRERRLQQATLRIKQRFGKNALVKGTNLQEGATAMERNMQIGGHKA